MVMDRAPSVIETARLRLREMCDADAPFILEVLTDPDFIANVGDRGVHDLPAAQRYISERIVASYRAHGFGLYLVELRASSAPLGMCGLLRRDWHPDVEIGFAYVPRARRQGYALEAACATRDFAQGTLGLTRIVALASPRNQPSLRLLGLAGFRTERTLRSASEGRDWLLLACEPAPHTPPSA